MPSQAGSRELARISRRFLPLIPAVGRIEAALLADLPGGGRQTAELLVGFIDRRLDLCL